MIHIVHALHMWHTRTCCTSFLMAAQLFQTRDRDQAHACCGLRLLLLGCQPVTCLRGHHTPGLINSCQPCLRRGHLEVHLSLLQQLHVPLWVAHPAVNSVQE